VILAAELSAVNPEWGWQAVLFAFAIAGITAAWMQALNGRRAQKRDVTLMEEFATRKELAQLADKVESKFEDLRSELKDAETRIITKGEERVVKIHDRTNLILAAVSKMEGVLDVMRGREDK
jgi:hypothetical protein